MDPAYVAECDLPATIAFDAREDHVAINEEWCEIG
jgi:hypothetical protein